RTKDELPAIAGELNIETKIPDNSSHKNETALPEQTSASSEQFVAVKENDLAIKDEQNKKASVVNQKMETPVINNPNQLPDASKNPNVLLAAADNSTTNNTDYASADFNNL